MNSQTQISDKAVRWIVVVSVLAFVVVFFVPAFAKVGYYESTGRAPRLREMVGQRIVIPERDVGDAVPYGPTIGTLTGVSYGIDEGWGMVALAVELDDRSTLHLSPSEADTVRIARTTDNQPWGPLYFAQPISHGLPWPLVVVFGLVGGLWLLTGIFYLFGRLRCPVE